MATGGHSEIESLLSQYVEAKHLYHSGEGESPLTDKEFDDLELRLKSIGSIDSRYFTSVGASAMQGRETVLLPIPIGSLEKVRTDSEIQKWVKNTPLNSEDDLIVMEKIDGCSVELVYKFGSLSSAYTRGDGVEGKNITRHVIHAGNVPLSIPTKLGDEIIIRGEIYMAEEVFKAKYLGKKKNSRNLVAGTLGRKQPGDVIKDCQLVAYHIFSDKLSKSSMLEALKDYGFAVPAYRIIQGVDFNQAVLTAIFHNFASFSRYLIDGLVVEIDNAQFRAEMGFETNSLNPAYARAFKLDLDSNTTLATVEDVDWSTSKDGLLKPRIILTPVELGGVTIRHATVYNAKYVVDNRIGKGAQVRIIRSGDVIPKVQETVWGAEPSLPDMAEFGLYDWNETGVDLVLKEESSAQMISKLLYFFTTLEVDNIGEGVVEKLYASGFTTVYSILSASADEFEEKVPGFKKRSSERLRSSLDKALSDVSLPLLMKATGAFGRGFGESKSQALVDHFKGEINRSLLARDPDDLLEEIISLPGYSSKTAFKFVDGLPRFFDELDRLSGFLKIASYQAPAQPAQGAFSNKGFVFSGFRDKSLETEVTAMGGTIQDKVSQATSYLVLKSLVSTSSKTKKAQEMGVSIIDIGSLLKLIKEGAG